MHIYVRLHFSVLLNAPVRLNACGSLASTTYQHSHVLGSQMLCAPGDGTMPQGLARTAGKGSVLQQGLFHCPRVTDLVWTVP